MTFFFSRKCEVYNEESSLTVFSIFRTSVQSQSPGTAESCRIVAYSPAINRAGTAPIRKLLTFYHPLRGQFNHIDCWLTGRNRSTVWCSSFFKKIVVFGDTLVRCLHREKFIKPEFIPSIAFYFLFFRPHNRSYELYDVGHLASGRFMHGF